MFTLEPKGDSTNVNWRMDGPTPYFVKIVHVFMDMDKLVGKDFETGLFSFSLSSFFDEDSLEVEPVSEFSPSEC